STAVGKTASSAALVSLVVADRVAAHVVGEGAAVLVDVARLVVERDVQKVGSVVHADVVHGRGGAGVPEGGAPGLRQVGAVIEAGFVAGRAGSGGIGFGHR